MTNRLLCFLVLLVPFVASWQPSTPRRQQQQRRHQFNLFVNRRDVMEDIFTTGVVAATTAGGVLLVPPKPAQAAAQPPIDNVGTMGSQTPLSATPSAASSATDVGVFIGETTQFTTLPNGVKIKDFKIGTGTDMVRSDSQKVDVQMSGRLINTNAGVTFYNTKNNNPDGFGAIPLTINLSKGEALPGLETGLIGMKKNGVRRIVVPAGDLSYNKFPSLEPKPMNNADQRALDSVVKNPGRDATIMFDVRLERFSK
eukprot:CAMPEP_0198275058 /NCGR_PEP_ID=MMETSP1447-20131203/62960_1 /TAXON_ID=420782 /ORGANISM="Chaetoceros dichaeta, Strain CCMP1751" /LENGTH=254 /DNA_ID=CAMNT_0043969633 /DNA_START=54 /DNA_END=818 /DNA_ORIENTATION=+